jgi:hypothetical protein
MSAQFPVPPEGQREALRNAWPEAFAEGRKRGLRNSRAYPEGFGLWPLDKRNAWFAGFNIGFIQRRPK